MSPVRRSVRLEMVPQPFPINFAEAEYHVVIAGDRVAT